MKTIIHDLEEKEVKKLAFNKEDILISSLNCNKSCIGCFSCWIKHPTKCAIKDEYSNIVDSISKSDELVLISKSRYGCYSANVKMVLERCIGYVLPFFTIRSGAIHHQSRYPKKLKFSVYFYGNLNEDDKKIACDLVKANSINLNASSYNIKFIKELKELSKCIQ